MRFFWNFEFLETSPDNPCREFPDGIVGGVSGRMYRKISQRIPEWKTLLCEYLEVCLEKSLVKTLKEFLELFLEEFLYKFS